MMGQHRDSRDWIVGNIAVGCGAAATMVECWDLMALGSKGHRLLSPQNYGYGLDFISTSGRYEYSIKVIYLIIGIFEE